MVRSRLRAEWRLEYRFVELDRATIPSDRLAAMLARYARLYRFRPRAERKAPSVPHRRGMRAIRSSRRCWWSSPIAPPRELERRLSLSGLCHTEPVLERTPEVEIYFCLLEDLAERGPFAAIFTRPRGSETPVDWVGRRPDDAAQGAAVADGSA